MVKCELQMAEEFLLKLYRMADKSDEIIPKVLEAGGEVVLTKAYSNTISLLG